MPAKNKASGSHKDMLEWQYRTIIAELSHVSLHSADESCPCNQVALDPPEYCLGKHLLNVSSLASETAMMDSQHGSIFNDLAEESMDLHLKAKNIYCKGGAWPDLADWSRTWRKKLEPIYYSCDTRKKVKLAEYPLPEQNTLRIALSELIDQVSHETTRECGLTLCQNGDGQLLKGSSSCGSDDYTMSIAPACPNGTRAVAIVHTHPGGNPEPSEPDIQAAHKSGLAICNITRKHGLVCFRS
jgi:hypothetical protein